MATGLFNLKQVNQAISQGAWSGYIAPRWVEYLVVAGGGAGGINGGGGGAGGLLTGIVPVAAGASYTVTVGAGGAGNDYTGAPGAGVASVFGPISATGGGAGGQQGVNAGNGVGSGNSGGSGGGGGYEGSYTVVAGQGVFGQGNRGGINDPVYETYGGGGGAGTVGINGATNVAAGKGGAGIASSISGTVTTYAGGGGGGNWSATTATGAGGVGGGGAGARQSTAISGSTNTGGGGGGSTGSGGISGTGGSGIVIVRYPGTVQFFTGGTVNYAGGHIVHTFYSSGTLAPTTPTPYSNTYQISRSLRFNSADSPYLNRTPASAGNRRTWTWSGWVKRTAFGANGTILSCGTSYSETGQMAITFSTGGGNDTDCLNITTGEQVFRRSTNQLRDPSAWYHLVVAFDTTQAAASDRVKMYINGDQVTSFVLSNNPVLNTQYGINQAALHHLGGNTVAADTYLNGYMTDVHFIDGQQLTPSSFGEYDVNTGVWIPRSYGGSYGTNGFKLNFSDNTNTTAATLGADSSGNGNNWTPNNFSVTAGVGNDSFVDTPTPYGTDTGVGGEVRGNYATWDALGTPSSEHGGNGFHLANGNLQTGDGSDLYYNVYATIAPKSGKFYVEKNYTSIDSWSGLGITRRSLGVGGSYAAISSYFSPYLLGGGDFANNTSSNAFAWGYSISNTDTISMAIDYDNRAVWFAINGVWIDGNGSQSSATVLAQIIAGDTSSAAFTWASTIDDIVIYSRDRDCIAHTNFGQRAWTYTAPTGFKALCTTNLPTPTIGSSPTTLATQYFGVNTWTGNGTSQTITNGGFQPDWVWVKERSAVRTHCLTDSVRGFTKYLFSDSTGAEETYSTLVTSVNSNGFNLGASVAVNDSGQTYVGWQWKANGSGSTNTAGSITSTVSASTTSGFSIVTYTGTGSAATVGHGLGVAPSMIICKGRSVGGNYWQTQHSALGPTKALFLNTTDAAFTNSGYWNNTAPTSTVFSLGGNTDANGNGTTYVAYCFAPIAGFSAFGSYIGNGSADGPVVQTGFKPAFIMIKRYESASSADWQIIDVKRDTYNASGLLLQPNATYAESDPRPVLDILSNGFKHRNTYAVTNYSTATYIYMAIAEHPFKYSLAR